jgi:hypothetical protein
MKVFRQIEIDDKQRHREGENAVGQGIEPAFRNKLLGFSHDPSPVFQSNSRRYVSGEEIQSKATPFETRSLLTLTRRYPRDFTF